jgi:four helix bundle protein
MSRPFLTTLFHQVVVDTLALVSNLDRGEIVNDFACDRFRSPGYGDAKDQLRRSSMSVELNVSEAAGRQGKDRRRFREIALGSARETRAGLAVLSDLGLLDAAVVNSLDRRWDRVCVILYRLT